MVLVTPKVEVDESSPYGGFLRISFPKDSGSEEFVVPLKPSGEILSTWKLYVILDVNRSLSITADTNGTTLQMRRIDDISMWGTSLDGYICETPPLMPSASGRSPSTILSEYLEKPVQLVYKGGRPRPCDKTSLFPELEATAVYQDGYPLLVLSEENVEAVEKELRGHVGTQGIEERWATDRIVVER